MSNNNDDDTVDIILPKLITLKLRDLPQLKTVCKGISVYEYENVLDIHRSPNLEGLPKTQVSYDYDNSNSDYVA